MTVHAAPRYFEDFEVGQVFELGERRVTRDEILAFAREFDPQPFHVDEEKARETMFGGLVASGWHTVSIFMRLNFDGLLAGSASMGSPGVDELRWLRPVRPGDLLRGRGTVLAAEPSSKRADRGTVHLRCELENQDGELVLTMVARIFFARRQPIS